jgi:hypothetical protein
MAAVAKKVKIEKDRFTDDGVRLFNPSKPHGVVYSDGYVEVKYIQEYEGHEVQYRGDGAPVGYEFGVPLPKHADELLEENAALNARIKDLETSQARTNALLEQLMAKLNEKQAVPLTPETPASSPRAKATDDLATPEAPARGAQKPK